MTYLEAIWQIGLYNDTTLQAIRILWHQRWPCWRTDIQGGTE